MKRDHQKMGLVPLDRCQLCGWEGDGLARHHIVERAKTQCDDAANLVVLCEACHRNVHGRSVDLGVALRPSQGAKAVELLGTVYAAFIHLYPSESPKRGHQVDHLCRNPSCVNPYHLEVVTARENSARGLKGWMMKKCKRGHPWTPENQASNGSRKTCRICKQERERQRKRALRGELP